MKQYSINEMHTATQDQTEFRIDSVILGDTISVFVNGALKLLGEDKDYFIDKESCKIVFYSPLYEGDVVSIASTINSSSSEVVSAGRTNRSNVLYKKYGADSLLKPNNKYEIHIGIGNENFRWGFTSKLNPFFVQPRKIWEDIGEFIEGFTEEYIASMIYRNSVEVVELIDELANTEEAIENVTYSVDNEGMYSTTHRAVTNWVKLKTEIDLIYARYYGISYKYGIVEKEVGDIRIRKETKLPYIDNLLERLKDQFEDADQTIRGLNIVVSAVKAIVNYKYDNWARETNF